LKRDRIFGIAFAMLLSLSVIIAPAATPAGATVQSCVLYANTPYRTANYIEATAGRSGCGNQVNLHIRIRQDISFWPDSTLAEQFVTVVNYDGFLSFPCFGFGSTRKVFSEAIVGSQKVQSSRVTIPCD
jgi:hypothetical protein